MFTLEQLSQLLAVEEYGTLSAAAEALHISQPSLTRSMQKLEEELGVVLFERTKNKALLNEAGRLAVTESRQVIHIAEGMQERMASYARSLHTISIGSCAPAPMWLLTPRLSQYFPDKAISSEMKSPSTLLAGLCTGTYQLIIMDAPVDESEILCRELITERLFISLPPAHPLAKKGGVYLSELAGQTMLLYSDLGIWQKLSDEKMRDVHFIVQTERAAFTDLISASVLPNFTSSLTRILTPPPMNRVDIPILDLEATVTFFLCAKKKDKKLLEEVLSIFAHETSAWKCFD